MADLTVLGEGQAALEPGQGLEHALPPGLHQLERQLRTGGVTAVSAAQHQQQQQQQVRKM
jgi:hypothetical protein